MVRQDQHHVRLRRRVDAGGVRFRQHPDALVGLAEAFGQDVRPPEPTRRRQELRQPDARVGQDPHLRVLAARPQRVRGVVAVRGDEQGIVPGERDGRERRLQRPHRRDHAHTQPGRPHPPNHPVEQGIARRDDHGVRVRGQGAQCLDGRVDPTQHHPPFRRHPERVEVSRPAHDEGGGRRGIRELGAGKSQQSIDDDHASPLVVSDSAPRSRRSRAAPGSAARNSWRNPGW